MATAIMRLTTGVVYVRSISGTISTSGITASGHLLFSPDNTYDIGAAGATRPRTIYPGTSVAFSNSGLVSWRNAANTQTVGMRLDSSDIVSFGGGSIYASGFQFWTASNAGWTISSGGHLLGATDNSYDIGASGATRPRSIYVAANAVIGNTVTANNMVVTATAGYGGTNTTGTLVTNDAQSVLTATAIFLGANTIAGMFVVQDNASVNAIFSLNGSNNSTSEVADPLANFSVTKDTAGSINVYYDAAGASGAGYYLQNTRGSTRSIRMVRIGV